MRAFKTAFAPYVVLTMLYIRHTLPNSLYTTARKRLASFDKARCNKY